MQGFLGSVSNAGELEPSLMLDSGFWDLEHGRAGICARNLVSPRGRCWRSTRCGATGAHGSAGSVRFRASSPVEQRAVEVF
jgi:hypothetical protein